VVRRPLAPGRAGFTMVEVLLASAMVLVLMFGALVSVSESFEVVREGDRRVHTHIQTRRALDRVLRDIRFSRTLDLAGDPQSGWTIVVETTGTLDPGLLTYTWDPVSRELRATDGIEDDLVLEDLRAFAMSWQTTDVNGTEVITQVSITWTVGVHAGLEAGKGAREYELQVGGAAWVRTNVQEY